MTTLNAGEDVKKVNHLYIAGGNVMASLENGLAISFKKINKQVPYDLDVAFQAFIPEKWKHIFIQKPVYKCL